MSLLAYQPEVLGSLPFVMNDLNLIVFTLIFSFKLPQVVIYVPISVLKM